MKNLVKLAHVLLDSILFSLFLVFYAMKLKDADNKAHLNVLAS